MKVSFMEIYNDVLFDLLNPQTSSQLKLKEHGDHIFVNNLSEIEI